MLGIDEVAIGLLNRDRVSDTISTTASEVGPPDARGYVVRDLWIKTESTTSESISATIDAHGLGFLSESVNACGEDTLPTQYLSDWQWLAAYSGWDDVNATPLSMAIPSCSTERLQQGSGHARAVADHLLARRK